MPAVGKITEIQRSSRKLSFEWQIPHFFRWAKIDGLYQRAIPNYPRSGRISDSCLSPTFSFCNDIWTLNLDTDVYNSKSSCVGLCFFRHDEGSCRTVRYTFAIKDLNGKALQSIHHEQDFTEENREVISWPDFWSLSYLRKRKSRLVPGNVLTIVGVFDSDEPTFSLHRIYWYRSLNSLLTDGGSPTDFTLKTGNRDWPVHKHILGSKSEYFASMFRQEWSENCEGEVRFDDIKEGVMDCVLKFIYGRNIGNVLLEFVCDIYVTADKFLLWDLKMSCIKAMIEYMGPDIIWGALAIVKIYNENNLKEHALEYLSIEDVKNACMPGWKQFKQNHPSIAVEVMKEINSN